MNNRFESLYLEKLTTPERAAALGESGQVCASDIGLVQTPLFYEAVAQRIAKGELKEVVQHSLLDFGKRPFFDADLAKEYRGVSWFSGAGARKAINGGFGDVMPSY